MFISSIKLCQDTAESYLATVYEGLDGFVLGGILANSALTLYF